MLKTLVLVIASLDRASRARRGDLKSHYSNDFEIAALAMYPSQGGVIFARNDSKWDFCSRPGWVGLPNVLSLLSGNC